MENEIVSEEKKSELEKTEQAETQPAEIMITSAETGHATPGVHLVSKKQWFIVGIVIAILNPIFSGLLFGIVLWREPEMKREGKIITAIAVAWGVVVAVLVKALRDAGY